MIVAGRTLFNGIILHMNDEPLSITIITTLAVFALIGFILFYVGSKKKRRNLQLIGIGFLLAVGVILFVESAEIRSTLIALAAVIAALIAAMSFDESRKLRKETMDREAQDRIERLEREKRERKIQLLNEIIHWAEDLVGCAYLEKPTDMHLAGNLIQRYLYINSKQTYITKCVSFFQKEEFNTLLSNVLSGKNSIANLITGLYDLEKIDWDIDIKLKTKETHEKAKNPDNVLLASICLEIANLHTKSALKWAELEPTRRELFNNIIMLIEYTSKLKMSISSEFSSMN